MDRPNQIAQRIQETCEKQDLTDNLLAALTGTEPDMIRMWRTGELIPDHDELIILANELNVSKIWLETGQTPETIDISALTLEQKQVIQSLLTTLKSNPYQISDENAYQQALEKAQSDYRDALDQAKNNGYLDPETKYAFTTGYLKSLLAEAYYKPFLAIAD